MAEVRLRTVDSFTDRPFTGNPAAVLLLDHAPPDEWMAAVARETNVSDTGFVIRETLPSAVTRRSPLHIASSRMASQGRFGSLLEAAC